MTENKGEIVAKWWAERIHTESGAARALAARLRRADQPSEVLAHEEVNALARALHLRDPIRVALIAQTVAAVTEWGEPLARAFGRKKDERRVLSELRFQRILRAEGDDLRRALRRALPLADHRCDVARLGNDLYWWSETTRAGWCFEYFGVARPDKTTPHDETDETEENPE